MGLGWSASKGYLFILVMNKLIQENQVTSIRVSQNWVFVSFLDIHVLIFLHRLCVVVENSGSKLHGCIKIERCHWTYSRARVSDRNWVYGHSRMQVVPVQTRMTGQNRPRPDRAGSRPTKNNLVL